MSSPNLKDLEDFRQFKFERVLNEDPLTLLGTFPGSEPSARLPAIVRIERTALSPDCARDLCVRLLSRVELIDSNDIYTWVFGWLGDGRDRDVKMNVVCPATDVHIRKYTKQELVMVHETAAVYERIVKPYIASFPASRTQWVADILSGKQERENVLYDDPSPASGFVIVPDMKWDLSTVSALYLVAIARCGALRSVRDLRAGDVGMLLRIRREAGRVVWERWGLGRGAVRLFVHYPPSYYHLHVHIVNANASGNMGMTVGQGHLLDDLISMLELDGSVFERMTLTYGLGREHALLDHVATEMHDHVDSV